jgi:ABC-2 type transport system permease protein
MLPVLILWIRTTGTQANTAAGTAANLAALGGVMTFGVMSACFWMLAMRLVDAHENGTLKRLKSAPLPPSIYFGGQIIASIELGLLAVVVTVLFGYTEHIHLGAHMIPQ